MTVIVKRCCVIMRIAVPHIAADRRVSRSDVDGGVRGAPVSTLDLRSTRTVSTERPRWSGPGERCRTPDREQAAWPRLKTDLNEGGTMMRQRFFLASACLGAAALSGAILALHGCSGDGTGELGQPAVICGPDGSGCTGSGSGSTVNDGVSNAISALPFVDAASNAQLLGELLARPTALGETTALQVRLPPPTN